MLLLVRFVLLMLSGRFRPRLGPLESSVVRCTVLPNDCDLNLHLNAGRFVSFMDIARIELLVRMRVLSRLVMRGWRPVMGGCTIRFRRSILPFERFDIRTRVLGWDDKWFYLEHVVERQGNHCATGIARVLMRRRGGNVAPSEFLELLHARELASPPLPAFVTAWIDAENAR